MGGCRDRGLTERDALRRVGSGAKRIYRPAGGPRRSRQLSQGNLPISFWLSSPRPPRLRGGEQTARINLVCLVCVSAFNVNLSVFLRSAMLLLLRQRRGLATPCQPLATMRSSSPPPLLLLLLLLLSLLLRRLAELLTSRLIQLPLRSSDGAWPRTTPCKQRARINHNTKKTTEKNERRGIPFHCISIFNSVSLRPMPRHVILFL